MLVNTHISYAKDFDCMQGTGDRGFEPRSGLAVPQNCYCNDPFQYTVARPTYYGR